MPEPVMTVKEARELLGTDAESMTDEQVAKLVEDVDVLAKLALDVAKDKLAREKANNGE